MKKIQDGVKKSHSKAINVNIVNNCSFLMKGVMKRKKKGKLINEAWWFPADFKRMILKIKYLFFSWMKNNTDFSLCFMRPEQQVLWVTVIHINLPLFLIMVKAFKTPQSIAFDHCISYTGAQWNVCYGFQCWKCMNSYANYSEPECTYQEKKEARLFAFITFLSCKVP